MITGVAVLMASQVHADIQRREDSSREYAQLQAGGPCESAPEPEDITVDSCPRAWQEVE
jgi:hypothetical protein